MAVIVCIRHSPPGTNDTIQFGVQYYLYDVDMYGPFASVQCTFISFVLLCHDRCLSTVMLCMPFELWLLVNLRKQSLNVPEILFCSPAQAHGIQLIL